MLREKSASANLPLRLWVSYADCGQENRAALEGLLRKLGLTLRNSSSRWAAYVALGGFEAQPLDPIVVPDRPAMNRGAWKAAAAVLASSLAFGSAACDTTGEERGHFSLYEKATNGPAAVPAHQDAEPMPQAENNELPGVEHDLVISAPPRESRRCLGVVTTVSKGRNDLPMSDSDWAAIVTEDDEG